MEFKFCRVSVKPQAQLLQGVKIVEALRDRRCQASSLFMSDPLAESRCSLGKVAAAAIPIALSKAIRLAESETKTSMVGVDSHRSAASPLSG